jgi:hypothetical protein
MVGEGEVEVEVVCLVLFLVLMGVGEPASTVTPRVVGSFEGWRFVVG